MKKTIYIGMDVHSKVTVFFVQDEEGKQIAQGKVRTTEEELRMAKEWIEGKVGRGVEIKVGLESGNMARYVVMILRRMGWEAIVIDAREVRAKASRINQKSDMRDAREICDGIRRGIYSSLVHIPGENIERLRGAISRRKHFVKMMTTQVNAVKRLLRVWGLGHIYRKLVTNTAWKNLLKKVDDKGDLFEYIKMHYEMWCIAKKNVECIEKMLVEIEKPFEEESRRLQTIPGIGWITALTAVAVLSDVSRFPSVKHSASYIGIVPQTYQSGDCDRHGHITRRGNSYLRSLLVESAHHASSSKHPLNPYIRVISAKRGYKVAVTAVAHRLIRIMVAMLKHKKDFDVGMLNVEKGTYTTTKTLYYKIKKPEMNYNSLE